LLASSGLFFSIVQALVPLNRNLRIVEGIVLHPKAIADAYKQALGWRDTTALMYTVKLALLMAARPGVAFLPKASSGSAFAPSTSMSIRSHHPDDVALGIQYEPAEVAHRCYV
jgi:hypothetical protein